MVRCIVVTGGNTGIGFALCRQLVHDRGCRVFLGARDPQRGAAAVDRILSGLPAGCSGSAELLVIDVSDDESVRKAAIFVKGKLGGECKSLYALVNNAGTGLAHGSDDGTVINVNLYGPKRVCEAFLPLLDESEGRIVNVGSGSGPSHVACARGPEQAMLTSWDTRWEDVEAYVKRLEQNRFSGNGNGSYGVSKACLTVYGMILAQAHPNLKVSTLSPGFIDTAIVKGFGASKTPEEGTVSLHHCLFEELRGSGYYYGSDGLRSPLHYMRNPGEPEYAGE